MTLKKIFVIALALLTAGAFSVSAAEKNGSEDQKLIRKIRENLKKYYRDTTGKTDGKTPMPQKDGSLAGVDYADRKRSSWTPGQHYSLMASLAVKHPEEAGKMLDFWIARDPQSDNWWYQSIGTPLALVKTVILLDVKVNRNTKLGRILDRSKMGMTGQNKVWLAGIHLVKGVLFEDVSMIREGREAILSELAVAPKGKAGLQYDWSFLQHGQQMQFGNYGLSYFNSMAQWAEILNGTVLAFPKEKLELLRNFYMEGLRWTLWNDFMDVNACGRQLVHNFPEVKYKSVIRTASRLKKKGILKSASLPENGGKYYPSSAYLVHRTEDLFFSVKMCTPEIIGSERVNEENSLGRFSGDGAVFLYLRKEKRNALDIGLRNWQMVPGTTELLHAETPLFTEWKRNIHGGACGLTESPVSGCLFRLDTGKISVCKAYFCFGNRIVCIGRGITTSENDEVSTCVYQKCVPPAAAVKEKKRFVCSGMAYTLPKEGEFYYEEKTVHGDWKNINRLAPSQPVSGKMLTVSIRHGKRPSGGSYCYVIEPEKNQYKPLIFYEGSSPMIFAVQDKESQSGMVAFFVPGSIMTPLIGEIEEKEPSLHIFRDGKHLRTPLYKEKKK